MKVTRTRTALAILTAAVVVTSGLATGLAAGEVTTTMVSRTPAAQTNGESTWPSVSRTGRYVAFESAATNLVPTDTNNHRDVFVTDRATGLVERVSLANDGSQTSGVGIGNTHPALSADGSVVAFSSDADGLTSNAPTNTQVYVRDRAQRATEHVSRVWGPVLPGAPARFPAL